MHEDFAETADNPLECVWLNMLAPENNYGAISKIYYQNVCTSSHKQCCLIRFLILNGMPILDMTDT